MHKAVCRLGGVEGLQGLGDAQCALHGLDFGPGVVLGKLRFEGVALDTLRHQNVIALGDDIAEQDCQVEMLSADSMPDLMNPLPRCCESNHLALGLQVHS